MPNKDLQLQIEKKSVEINASQEMEANQQAEHINQQDIRRVKQQKENQMIKLLSRSEVDISSNRLSVNIPSKTALNYSYGKKFSDRISSKQRVSKQKNKKSRLYAKIKTADLLNKNLDNGEDIYEKTNNYVKSMDVNISKHDFNDLSHFIAYQSDEQNEDLLKTFFGGKDEQGNACTDEYHAKMAIMKLADQILGINLKGISLNSDRDIAVNAATLERVSRQVAAFDSIAYRYGFMKIIDKDVKEAIEMKLISLRAVCNYYIIRKDIIDDDEYKNHYDDELTMDISKATTKGQKALAKKLMQAFVIGKNMMRINGVDAKHIKQMKNPEFKDSAAAEQFKKIATDYDISKVKKYKKNVSDNYSGTYYEASRKYANAPTEKLEIKLNESIATETQVEAFIRQTEKMTYGDKLVYSLLTADELTPLKDKRELAAVKKDIAALQSFYDNALPPVVLDKKGKVDKEKEAAARKEIDAVCISVKMLCERLTSSINAVVEKYGAEFPDSCAVLKELSKQTGIEGESFREKTLEFRELMISDPTLRTKPMTIKDALRHVRSVFYDLDGDKNIKYSTVGANASMIYKISNKNKKAAGNAKGNQIVFFREKDYVPTKDNAVLTEGVFKKYKISGSVSEKLIATLVDSMTKDNKAKGIVIRDTISECKQQQYSPSKTIEMVLGCIHRVMNVNIKVDKKEEKEVTNALIEYADAIAKRSMSSGSGMSAKISNGRNLSDRNVATSRMATLLGIQDMVCDSRTAAIRKDGKIIQGNLMENSNGVDTLVYTPGYSMKAITQIFEMQVFDFICGQTDRHFGNFHGIIKNNVVDQIRCIDNDMAFGKLKSSDIGPNGYNRIVPITKNGIYGLPESFINKIMALDRPYMEQVLGDIIDKEELDALEERLNFVKQTIVNLAATNDDANWDAEKKKFSFKGKMEDQELRQLYTLDNIIEECYETGDGMVCSKYKFADEGLYNLNIDGRIIARKKALSKSKGKKV